MGCEPSATDEAIRRASDGVEPPADGQRRMNEAPVPNAATLGYPRDRGRSRRWALPDEAAPWVMAALLAAAVLRIGGRVAARPGLRGAVRILAHDADRRLRGVRLRPAGHAGRGIDRLLESRVGRLLIFLLDGSGVVATLVLRGITPRNSMLTGCLFLLAGVAVTFGAIATTTSAAFLAGTAVAGV